MGDGAGTYEGRDLGGPDGRGGDQPSGMDVDASPVILPSGIPGTGAIPIIDPMTGSSPVLDAATGSLRVKDIELRVTDGADRRSVVLGTVGGVLLALVGAAGVSLEYFGPATGDELGLGDLVVSTGAQASLAVVVLVTVATVIAVVVTSPVRWFGGRRRPHLRTVLAAVVPGVLGVVLAGVIAVGHWG